MNTYEKPLKVLVCGTNFGRVYLKGLERCGDKFKIAGIFSHGSTQSKQEAEKYGVPLITDLNEVSKKKILIWLVLSFVLLQLEEKGQRLPVRYLKREYM
ncbi:MAG: Gfo/Idh/MocA family oxidoreductase [Dorea sp.]